MLKIAPSSTKVKDPSTILEIGEMDAAIVLRADGTLEASIPEVTTENVPENILAAASIIHALNNEDLSNIMRRHFIEQCFKKESS